MTPAYPGATVPKRRNKARSGTRIADEDRLMQRGTQPCFGWKSPLWGAVAAFSRYCVDPRTERDEELLQQHGRHVVLWPTRPSSCGGIRSSQGEGVEEKSRDDAPTVGGGTDTGNGRWLQESGRSRAGQKIRCDRVYAAGWCGHSDVGGIGNTQRAWWRPQRILARETQDGAGTKVQGSLCGRLEDYEAERGAVWVQLQGKSGSYVPWADPPPRARPFNGWEGDKKTRHALRTTGDDDSESVLASVYLHSGARAYMRVAGGDCAIATDGRRKEASVREKVLPFDWVKLRVDSMRGKGEELCMLGSQVVG
ncbi:hypothetical protein C8J57DRAFT_1470326 [Mycena rebaudengoi]|nr:hypothetical protein C8J57DRAFT_1470326 [Mycena rebaudengoi]